MPSLTSRIVISVFVFFLGIASIAYAETTGQYIDDATITTKIKAALATDTVLKQSDVTVTTNKGAVQLTGTVRSKEQEDEVVRLAKHTDGVISVEDLLRLQPVITDQ